MRAQAVAAQVALGDSEGNLLADLGVEAAAGQRAAEVEIALKCCGRIAEHAEEVRHDAELGLHAVEELFGLACRLGWVELGDAIHVFSSRMRDVFRIQLAARQYCRTRCMPSGVFPLKA